MSARIWIAAECFYLEENIYCTLTVSYLMYPKQELCLHILKKPNVIYDNAKDIVKTKLRKRDGFYNDPKYVRMAGNTAWAAS